MIGEKLVNAATTFGGFCGKIATEVGSIVDHGLGGFFSNNSLFKEDLRLGIQNAWANKTAAVVVQSGLILMPAVIGIGLGIVATRYSKEGFRTANINNQDTIEQSKSAYKKANMYYVGAACCLVAALALNFSTVSELRQMGASFAQPGRSFGGFGGAKFQ